MLASEANAIATSENKRQAEEANIDDILAKIIKVAHVGSYSCLVNTLTHGQNEKLTKLGYSVYPYQGDMSSWGYQISWSNK